MIISQGFFFLLLIAASFVFLQNSWLHLLVSGLLAFLLAPLVTGLGKIKVPRSAASLIVLLLFFLSIAVAFIFTFPIISKQGEELFLKAPAMVSAAQTFLKSFLGKNFYIFDEWFSRLFELPSNTSHLVDQSLPVVPSSFAGTVLPKLVAKTIHSLGTFVSGLLGWFIVPLLSFYFLRDFYRIRSGFIKIFSEKRRKVILDLEKQITRVLNAYLRGQLLVCSALAFFYSLSFLMIGMDSPFVLGLLVGILNLIPYVGILTGIVMTFLLLLVKGATLSSFIVLGCIFLMGIFLEGIFLTPKIVGKRVNLGPIAVLISLMVGAELFGLLGLLFAIPTVAILKVTALVFLPGLQKPSLPE